MPRLDSYLVAPLLVAVALSAGCQSDTETPAEAAARQQQLSEASQAFAGTDLDTLMTSPEAMDLGAELFSAHCASCHGDEGQGRRRGVPDLALGMFNYGATPDAVRTTIVEGRHSVMPSMGRRFGEVELGQIVAYVQSLGSDEPLNDYELNGKALYEASCVECHGADGHGIRDRGTPNLTDDHWQHGDSMMNIRLVITRGVESRCPAHEDMSEAEIDLLTAFVMSLNPESFVRHSGGPSTNGTSTPARRLERQ